MTSSEVCELLKISTATLSRRISSGELVPLNPKSPFQKRAPAYEFSRSYIYDLMKAAGMKVPEDNQPPQTN